MDQCDDCKRPVEWCACMLKARAELAEARARESVQEALNCRLLWQASASCLTHNHRRIKPRGDDERKLIDEAIKADHGKFWAGTTKGWL